MLAKEYRLNENEVRKVLKQKKPFFSYGFVMNTLPNRLGYARVGIVFSAKHTKGSVNRNYFRRRIYDLSREYIPLASVDVVFVPKKGKTFDKKSETDTIDTEKDIHFLWKTFLKNTRLQTKSSEF